MTVQEVVGCCPWRLESPRPLTPYEWTIVEDAVHTGIADTRGMFSAETKAMAVALTMAVSKQVACPAWTHSAFGPEPAVATYAYGCLGSWWAGLDLVSQQKALGDIYSGLLCASNPPWSSCPIGSRDRFWKALSKSEYGEQKGVIPPGVVASTCILSRRRTVYTPLKGADFVELMRTFGGGVVPQPLADLAQIGGQMFSDRSFIVGWQLKTSPDWGTLGTMTGMGDVLKLLDGMLEEVVLIWAPGQGMSIRGMVTSGQIDPAAMVALLQQLLPGSIDQILGQLPAWIQQQLPGILQGLPPMPGMDWNTILGNVFGALGTGVQQHYLVEPSTPPTTGLPVVDAPASQQDTTKPPLAKAASVTGGTMDSSTLLAIGAVVLGVTLIWYGYKAR